ncbi:MAG: UDP-glucose 4-epimerase, partial [Coriobacteriales bacterium]|nr:UDP-glucose 4-epimerase [Coriobacteriales bacterium]
MNALVIGGAGYIGSHAVRELVRAGHSVVVLDDLSTGNAHAVHPSAKLIIGDILDKEGIVSIFESAADSGEPIDVVFHFAAKMIVSESVAKPLDYYRNNVVGMLSMLEAMVECGVRNLVFSS